MRTDAAFVPGTGWTLPFAALLVALAIVPAAFPRLWAHNGRKLAWAALFGGPVAALYASQAPHVLLHTASDYVSFIVLLGTLYVVSGGVMVDADLEATPATNTALLAAGAVVASVAGTTPIT